MNYDKAHDLAHAMRESEEYKELMAAQEAVKSDAVATALVRTFMAQQMQWEYAKLSGAPEADELQKKQEELMPQIQENAAATSYLQAQMRWSQISNDIYKIISEPITEGRNYLVHVYENRNCFVIIRHLKLVVLLIYLLNLRRWMS